MVGKRATTLKADIRFVWHIGKCAVTLQGAFSDGFSTHQHFVKGHQQ